MNGCSKSSKSITVKCSKISSLSISWFICTSTQLQSHLYADSLLQRIWTMIKSEQTCCIQHQCYGLNDFSNFYEIVQIMEGWNVLQFSQSCSPRQPCADQSSTSQRLLISCIYLADIKIAAVTASPVAYAFWCLQGT